MSGDLAKISPTLSNFLTAHKSKKGGLYTHTRISGGMYNIPDDKLPLFYELYHKDVILANKPDTLTEKQPDNGLIYIDLDFKYAELGRHHNMDFIEDVLMEYTNIIKKYIKFENQDQFECYVMERKEPYFNGSKNKDGLHIVFTVGCNNSIKLQMREDAIKNIDLSSLPLTNSANDVFDEGIMKGTTNLQLFGSVKPECKQYEIILSQKYVFDDTDSEFSVYPIEIGPDIMSRLSSRGNTNLLIRPSTHSYKPKEYKSTTKSSVPTGQFRDIKFLEITKCYSANRIDTANDWFQLGWGIANIFGKSKEVEDIFVDMNDICPKRSKKEHKDQARNWFQSKCEIRTGEKTIGWGSLVEWAKIDNPELVNELFTKWFPKVETKMPFHIDDVYSTGLMADFFKSTYKGKFMVVDMESYHFNGVYWKKDNKDHSIIHKIIDTEFYPDVFKIYNQSIEYYMKLWAETENGPYEKIAEKLTKFVKEMEKKMRNFSSRAELIKDIIAKCNESRELDINPYLFAFENKVFDLKQNAFVEPNPNDYLTVSCGWSYDEEYNIDDATATLKEVIQSIFPTKSTGDFYLEALSTGLYGKQIQQLVIATGVGGNGKSVIDQMTMSCVGNYGYKLPSTVLLNEIKEGANPQMANLHKKRFVITQEPDCKRRMNTSTMKELTGSQTLNVRDNYSSMCQTTLHNSTFMEANSLPLLDKVSGDDAESLIRRLRTVPFVSRFVDKSRYDEIEDKTNVFIGNTHYTSDEFYRIHRQGFFHILCEHFQDFLKNNEDLSPMNDECREAGKRYFMMSDDFIVWFNDTYEKDPNSMVYVADIFELYKYSSAFELLSKADKRSHTKSSFEEKIRKSMFLRTAFKSRDTRFNGIKYNKAYLAGYKLIDLPNKAIEADDEF